LAHGTKYRSRFPPGCWPAEHCSLTLQFRDDGVGQLRQSPAAGIVKVSQAQSQFKVSGTGIVADIDTGVDPNHPALQGVLLAGYDFTRNQTGAPS